MGMDWSQEDFKKYSKKEMEEMNRTYDRWDYVFGLPPGAWEVIWLLCKCVFFISIFIAAIKIIFK